MNGSRKVLFVLGSGVSAFKCPMIDEISKKVLDPSGLQLQSWHSKHNAYEIIKVLTGFLGELDKTARKLPVEPTYEVLFSMCKQLHDWEIGRNRDPALTQFRDHIYRETAQLWKFFEGGHYFGRKPLAAIARKSSILINEVIRVLISGALQHVENEDLKPLKLIKDAIAEYGAENVDVLTLNHDTLVEKLLEGETQWTTGFDPTISQDGDLTNYSSDAFANRSQVRIVKLHGSIDWYYVGTNKMNFRWVKMSPRQHQEVVFNQLKNESGETFYDDCETASELTGVTTKTQAYTEGIHGELYMQARQLLREHNHIICSGYGWKDYGVNTMLREWAKEHYQCTPKHLLLLHNSSNKHEFETNKQLRFWPDDWGSQKRKDWFQWYPVWLSETEIGTIDDVFWNN